MMRPILMRRCLLSIVAVGIVAGCQERNIPRETGQSEQRNMRGQMISELRKLASQSVVPVRFDSAHVVWSAEQSRAVDGLTYYWAEFVPPQSVHGGPFVVAGSNDQTYRILRVPSDWTAFISEDELSNAANAAALCAEMIRIIGGHPSIQWPAIIFSDSLVLKESILAGRDMTRSKELRLPMVTESSEGWTIDLWAFEEGIASRYLCKAPKPGSKLEITLAVLDSIPNGGLPPAGP